MTTDLADKADSRPWHERTWVDLCRGGLDRYPWLPVAFIVLLYLLGFQSQWRIGPDSAHYVEVARSLAAGEGYRYQGTPEGLLWPGLPWLMAVVFRFAGDQAFAVLNAVMLIFAAVGLSCWYRTLRFSLDRADALAVLTLTALCETVFLFSFHVLTDIPFFAGVMMMLAGYEGWVTRDS
ncbi:MAG: hypothetical protein R3336_00715, partial [Phycisphaeraceae bacterium]|nr:hypothetical protein [Phycisphaeraceae bacterium]